MPAHPVRSGSRLRIPVRTHPGEQHRKHLHDVIDDRERERWLKPGMSAVDLGAAPGGWTWQLVRRSIRVTAIDNGPMDRALMDSGVVTHLREDGFRYRPKKPVDWLVCEKVCIPGKAHLGMGYINLRYDLP